MKGFQRISKGFQTYFTKEYQVAIYLSIKVFPRFFIKVFFHVVYSYLLDTAASLLLSLNSYSITLPLRDTLIFGMLILHDSVIPHCTLILHDSDNPHCTLILHDTVIPHCLFTPHDLIIPHDSVIHHNLVILHDMFSTCYTLKRSWMYAYACIDAYK